MYEALHKYAASASYYEALHLAYSYCTVRNCDRFGSRFSSRNPNRFGFSFHLKIDAFLTSK